MVSRRARVRFPSAAPCEKFQPGRPRALCTWCTQDRRAARTAGRIPKVARSSARASHANRERGRVVRQLASNQPCAGSIPAVRSLWSWSREGAATTRRAQCVDRATLVAGHLAAKVLLVAPRVANAVARVRIPLAALLDGAKLAELASRPGAPGAAPSAKRRPGRFDSAPGLEGLRGPTDRARVF